MDSTSAMNATGSYWKPVKRPTTWFVKSGTERSSWYIDPPSKCALQSNDTYFLALLGLYMPCCGIYVPGFSQRWHTQAS